MTSHRIESRDGFEIHVLRSDAAEVHIVPRLGAKISRLLCVASGRDWMWSPPGGRLLANRLGDRFDVSSLIGADECFPTIGPCRWKDRDLPDHGEVWTEDWQVQVEGQTVLTTLKCPVSPFRIQRAASLEGNELKLAYELENLGAEEEAFLWAFHPLIQIQPGDRIDLPASRIITELAVNCPLGTRGQQWSWPNPSPEIDLSRLEFGSYTPAAAKVYTDDLRKGRVAVRNERTHEALDFLFDRQQLDTVGVWVNRGAWNGYEHIAVEPTNSAADPLDVANRWGRCGSLPARETRRWTVTLKISAPAGT